MPVIELHTIIHAPLERCFDLSRSIDLHKISTKHTDEEAIAGVTSGLIGLHESVTWRARHLGIMQKLTARITAYERPEFFVDEMVSGAFQSFRHKHRFKKVEEGTRMTDYFDYTAPLGPLGKLADFLFLKQYMTGFLWKRNLVIKEFAESDKWRTLL